MTLAENARGEAEADLVYLASVAVRKLGDHPAGAAHILLSAAVALHARHVGKRAAARHCLAILEGLVGE